VCTAAGREVASGKAPLEWEVTGLGVEIAPEAVLRAVGSALAAASAQSPPGSVAAVGVTGMGEAGVLLDDGNQPLTPVIAWHDDRDRALVDQLAADLGGEAFTSHTGLPVRPQWSLTKHRWLNEHHPGARRAVRRLGIPEWVVVALGGEPVSEFSLASRTGWLDLTTADWWPQALDWSGLPPALLPPLAHAGAPLGCVSAAWAPGRLAGAVLTVAGHDHLVAAVGAGAAADGDLLDSCGTAEALVRTVPAPVAADAVRRLAAAGVTVGHHVLPGRLALLGDTRGGLLLQNVQRLLEFDSSELASLDAQAMRHQSGTLRAALNPDSTVVLSGIGRGAGRAQAWYAALEAGAALVGRMDADLSAVVGSPRRVVMIGGWAHSTAVRELRRKLWGHIEVAEVGEAGGRGAALLAGSAAGLIPVPAEIPAWLRAQEPRQDR
jgi:sugar (pentulose or hexulose) kinase